MDELARSIVDAAVPARNGERRKHDRGPGGAVERDREIVPLARCDHETIYVVWHRDEPHPSR